MCRGKIQGWRFDARVHSATFDLASKKYPTVLLKHVVEINPRTFFNGVQDETLLSFVPMDAISDTHGVIATTKYRSFSENIGYTNFQEGDLLWAKITPCMENGKSAIAQNLLNGFGFGSTEYHVLRPKITGLNIRYLHFLLRLNSVRKAATNYFGGSSGHQRVDTAFFSRLHIPLPDISVQNQIVAELDKQELLAKSKRDAAANLLAGIDGYLLAELSITLPPAPENTLASRIFTAQRRELAGWRFDPQALHPEREACIAELQRRSFHPLRKAALFCRDLRTEIPEGVIYIGLENIESNTGRYIPSNDKESVSSAFVFRKGQVLFPKLRPYLNKVFLAPFDGLCSTEFHVLEGVTVCNEFLALFLRSNLVVKQTKHLQSGNTLPRLQTVDVETLLIPEVDELVQQRIIGKAAQWMVEAEKLRSEAQTELDAAKRRIEAMLLGKSV